MTSRSASPLHKGNHRKNNINVAPKNEHLCGGPETHILPAMLCLNLSFKIKRLMRARVVVPFSPGPAWVRADTGWIGSVVLASRQQQTNNTSESAQPTASVGEMLNLFKHLANTLRPVDDLETRLCRIVYTRGIHSKQ